MIERFADPERAASSRPPQTTSSAARRKDLDDSPIPSGNSAAAFGLLRLAMISGDGRYERHALGVLRLLFPMRRAPARVRPPARGADFYLAPVKEVAIVGTRRGAGSRGPRRVPAPRRARRRAMAVPLLEGRRP